jgi:hypothetical protein
MLMGLLVGWLAARLQREEAVADARAEEEWPTRVSRLTGSILAEPRGRWRGSVLEELARDSQTIVRGDMDTNPQYPEEKEPARAGLRSFSSTW